MTATSETPTKRTTKRNPHLAWDLPAEAQNIRQQARFLLMVEEAACGHPRWSPSATLLSRADVIALLTDAGVRVDLLLEAVGDRHKLQQAIKWVGKTPWKQATPSKSIYSGFKEDKFAIWSFVHHCSRTESEAERRARGDFYRVNHTELEKLIHVHGPGLQFHWRHQVPTCAEDLVRSAAEGRDGSTMATASTGGIGDLSPAAYHRMAERARELTVPLAKEERRRMQADPMPDLNAGFDTPEMRAWWVRNCGYDPVEEFKRVAGRTYGSTFRDSTWAAPTSGDWAVLGISHGASTEEIKAAFRQKAKEYHPDAGGDADRFRTLAAAYERITGAAK